MRYHLFYFFLLLLPVKGPGQRTDYTELYRPQFHFSPPAHWINDPNGLVYYQGEYHLFYQYYPDSVVWGPMHWGHAISRDLIHWKQLPIALYPDSLGYIFSGSVVVDEENSGGFRDGPEKSLVAIFTYHNPLGERAGTRDFQNQGIAYSNDRGRTWKKYKGNPVVKNPGYQDFRDPKVSWYPRDKEWIMCLAAGDRIRFYRSRNLKDWDPSGEFGVGEGFHGGVWECPDLFPLPLGEGSRQKWVLLVSVSSGAPNGGSGTQYFIGDFDGKTFRNEDPPQTIHWVDYGPDDYAGVTWSHTGQRRLFLGWMSNWQYAQVVPTKSWRGAMTIPRELSLAATPGGILLLSNPVRETELLRTGKKQDLGPGKTTIPAGLSEILATLDLKRVEGKECGIRFSNPAGDWLTVGFDIRENRFFIDRSRAGESGFSKEFGSRSFAPRTDTSGIVRLHMFLDQASLEIFADGGNPVMTGIFFPAGGFSEAKAYPENGKENFIHAEIYNLKSIWR